MALKEYSYRGKSLQELQALSLKEFAELLPSRERRTIKRGFTDNEKKCLEKIEKKGRVKTHSRELIILPNFVGKKISVHNGKQFVDIEIVAEMIGNRLGQYAQTRKRTGHSAPKAATKAKVSVK